MNQHKHASNLDQGRGWLNRAAEMLDSCEDHVSDAEFARAAAAIGNGFIALAHTERAAVTASTLDAAAERVRRAAEEARPHDDEPVLGDVIKCQQCGRQSRSISRGCSVCGLGTPEPRFLGFTEHGHPVVDQLPPNAVVPCGGAQACGACADDTGDLRRAAREADRG